MSRVFRLFLLDIQQASQRIIEFTDGVTLEQFKTDRMRADAVLMNLMVIGEAVKNLPDDTRQLSPETEWSKIAGLRDRIVHVYFGLDLSIIWNITQKNIPELLEIITRILEQDDPSDEAV